MNTSKKLQQSQKTFSLVIDRVPTEVKVVPFLFNEARRFYVSVNGGPEHVFVWDDEIKRLRAIDDQSSVLPDDVEETISKKIIESDLA